MKCKHEWVTVRGFGETFEYCLKCEESTRKDKTPIKFDSAQKIESLEQALAESERKLKLGLIREQGFEKSLQDMVVNFMNSGVREAELERKLGKAEEDKFIQGYVCAVSTLLSLHDHPTIAEDVLNEINVDWTKIDIYDKKIISKAGLIKFNDIQSEEGGKE